MIAYEGAKIRLRHTPGLSYLARLLREPARAIPASQLVGRTGIDPERARVIATKRIGAALRRIRVVPPRLAGHLNASVRRGSICTYVPAPPG